MGRYRATFSNQEILSFIKNSSSATTTELMLKFSVTRQDIHHRMTKLKKRGFIISEVGGGRKPTRYFVTKNQPWRAKIYDK